MRNVMNQQNFTHYPRVLELIKGSEQLFRNIQAMEIVVPLQAEERLFIDAIRDLNFQASKLQAVEQSDCTHHHHHEQHELEEEDGDQEEDSNESKPIEVKESQEKLSATAAVGTAPAASSTSSCCNNNVQAMERLHEATSVVVDAAGKLSSHHHNTSPNLDLVLGWMQASANSAAVNAAAAAAVHDRLMVGGGADKDAGCVTDGEVAEDYDDEDSREAAMGVTGGVGGGNVSPHKKRRCLGTME